MLVPLQGATAGCCFRVPAFRVVCALWSWCRCRVQGAAAACCFRVLSGVCALELACWCLFEWCGSHSPMLPPKYSTLLRPSKTAQASASNSGRPSCLRHRDKEPPQAKFLPFLPVSFSRCLEKRKHLTCRHGTRRLLSQERSPLERNEPELQTFYFNWRLSIPGWLCVLPRDLRRHYEKLQHFETTYSNLLDQANR